MNMQKFIVSGIVGGIASCLGGYLIYGMAMKSFFESNATVHAMRSPETMIWWSLVLGCVFMGLLYSYIFNKWANINSFGGGLGAGLILGLLSTAGMDLIAYGTADMMNITGTFGDIACGAILGAITGGVVGLMNGVGKKAG